MHIPVLAYHSPNILGNDYHNNDHIALAQDLKTIAELGINIITATQLVSWLQNKTKPDQSKKYVVLTFDDGCELDFIDWEHPAYGHQKSFHTIMKSYPHFIHATAFVIASPKDRKTLEITCVGGHEIWSDKWWQTAEDSGLISIENHSWDHLHHTLDKVKQKDNLKGDFKQVESLQDAHAQIEDASDYINSRINNKKTSLFAYPYGHYNTFLSEEYFPQQNQIEAAFTCESKHVTHASSQWKIPRFVCGEAWGNSKQLIEILTT